MRSPKPVRSGEMLPDRLTPLSSVISATHGDDTVLLNVATGRYYSLNRTGTSIWQWLCDDVSPVVIVHRLQEKYGIGEAAAYSDVRQLLHACATAQLFEESWSL